MSHFIFTGSVLQTLVLGSGLISSAEVANISLGGGGLYWTAALRNEPVSTFKKYYNQKRNMRVREGETIN
jgi:hypothetical protein